jgi:Cdc6-like AAA superfamily ATPase
MATIYGSDPSTLQRRMNDLSEIKLKTRDDILNLFTPNSPITTALKFAGREKPLEELTDALLTKGADLVLFAERGGGKTSLANMLHSIANGHLELLDYYGLRQRLERRGYFLNFVPGRTETKKFNVIWVDGSKRTVEQVINLVLTRRKERQYGPGLLYYLPTEADQTEVSAKIGFDRIFKSETELKEIHVSPKAINVREGFDLAMQRYTDKYDEELLIIIDEFETIPDKSEISQYMKSAKARFVIVGIAETTLDLLGEHASVARETQAIKLEPMTENELRQILSIGATILSPNYGFHPFAVDEIVRQSYGSPFWCQFFAKGLIQQELELAGSPEYFLTPSTPKEFTRDDVMALVASLPNRPDCRLFEEALGLITVQDTLTARILLCIANSKEGVISSAKVCSELESQGISKADVIATIEGFLKLSSVPLVERSRIRDIVTFSFADPNLKKYILIRNAGLATGTAGQNG